MNNRTHILDEVTSPDGTIVDLRGIKKKQASFFPSYRVIAYSLTSMILVLLWCGFDHLIDPQNFTLFVSLRVSFAVLTGTATAVFIATGMQERYYRALGLLVYILLIATILPMVVVTDHKFAYYLGFSTVFFGTSVMMIWPIRYLIIPMGISVSILGMMHRPFYLHSPETIVAIFLIANVCFISVLAAGFTYRNHIYTSMLLTKLNELSITDKLTSIFNRRYFDSEFEKAFAISQRTKTPISLLMADIDYFKPYNDNYGHHAGDICLQRVTECLRKNLRRQTDFIARYGGEEFVIVLPDTKKDDALRMAEHLVRHVQQMRIAHEHSLIDDSVTISIGVSTSDGKNKLTSPETLIVAADKALYMAKNNGRNRAESISPSATF